MRDLQSERDERGLRLDKVGVCNLLHPITVLDRNDMRQATTARISMSVDLPSEFKGTHMSRFVEALSAHCGEMTIRTLPAFLDDLRSRLNASNAHAKVEFPYFLSRTAPVSGAKALMDYMCCFEANQTPTGTDFLLGVTVPVTTVCPCSKAISDYGAHNQRATLSITVRPKRTGPQEFEWVWIEELIAIAEASGSSPVYALLKRSDERHVTMNGYDNPVFVEDVVRAASSALQRDARLAWFYVKAETHESIHNHNAFAEVTSSNTTERADAAAV